MDAVSGLPGLAAIWQVVGKGTGEGNEAAVRALLSAYVGKELEGLLEMLTPAGAKIRFPSGLVVAAEGEVAFPEGTTVRLQVQPRNGGQGYELRMLEAHPPALAPLLRPLVQGEASALMARLTQPDPPKELALLRQMLEALGRISAPPEHGEQTVESSLSWTPRQTAALPKEAQAEIASLLRVETEELPRFLEVVKQAHSTAAQTASPESAPLLSHPQLRRVLPNGKQDLPRVPGDSPSGSPEAEVPEGQSATELERATTLRAFLERRLDLPAELRRLLAQLVPEPKTVPKPSRSLAQVESQTESAEASQDAPKPEIKAPLRGQPKLEDAPRMTSLPKSELLAGRPADERVTSPRMETWVRETLRVLGDPKLSPREAPFHQLQAVEQTAYFELPAPWAGGDPVQLWVEWDETRPEAGRDQGEQPLRLLLGTRFSELGETRIGFLTAQEHLALRIWTEHPEHLESELSILESELRTCFRQVDMKVVPMGDGTPTVRELIMTPGWSALA